MSATCKTCGADIIWARTERGKAIPIDATPAATGNMYLRGPNNTAWSGEGEPVAHYARTAPGPDSTRYVTHFATCPQRKQHRRPT